MGYIFDALNNKKRDLAGTTPRDDAPLQVDDTGLSALIASAEQAQAEDAQAQAAQRPASLRLSDVALQDDAKDQAQGQAEDHADRADDQASDAETEEDARRAADLAAPLAAAMNLTRADFDAESSFLLPDAPSRAMAQENAVEPTASANDEDTPDTELADSAPLVIEANDPPPVRGLWNRLLGRHLRGKLDDRLVAMTSPASAMSEEYRSIRTSILARNENERHLVHTITSATPQEGKTITCVNLGLSFAELRNRRTVILECDLRLPTFAKLLNCQPDKPGLIDYLHGEAALKDIVQRVEGSPLHIIPAGGRVSDEAVQLISSGRMSRLIQALRAKYDHVLIDTPPVLQLADAGILGSQSEEVLLVARMRRTPRPLVEQAVNTLTSYNAQVNGIIATDNPRSRGRGYGYKYGYGYPYGYGYGYTSEKAKPAKKDKPREAA